MKMRKVSKNYHTIGQSHLEDNQAMMYKGNTGYLSCITDKTCNFS